MTNNNVTIIVGKVSVIMGGWGLIDNDGEEFSVEDYLPRFEGKKVRIIIREEE